MQCGCCVGPADVAGEGLSSFSFFFLKRFAKKETQRGGKLVSFFDPASLWLKSGSASSKRFKEEISDQLHFSLWLYGTTFHSSYQTSSFRPDSQQTMLEMVKKTQNQHTRTHVLCHSSRFFQQNPWKELKTAGTEAGDGIN